MPVPAEAGQAAGRLAATCKTLILKGARSAATGKTQGLAEILGQMALDWQQFRAALQPRPAAVRSATCSR